MIRSRRTASDSVNNGDLSNYSREEISLLVSPEEMQRIESEVIQSINQELVRSEELYVTVPRLLASCHNESAEVRRSMISMVSTQTGEAYRCLKILHDARDKVETLRATFVQQGTILSSMQTAACYHQLKLLNVFRSNVKKVIDWSEALKDIHHFDFYGEIDALKLLEMYERLTRTQDIRISIKSVANRDRAQVEVFEAYFSQFDAVILYFIAKVQSIFEDSVMITILNALVDDETEPEPDSEDAQTIKRFAALGDCIQICGTEIESPKLHHSTRGAGPVVLTQEDVKTWVDHSVVTAWVEEIMGSITDPFEKMDEYLESMKRLAQILVALESLLLPLSSRFPFFAIIVQGLNREVISVMEKYADPANNLEAEKLMETIKYMRWYSEMLEEHNFIQYVNAKEIDQIIADLMKSAINGMSEHLVRLSTSAAITTCSEPIRGADAQMFSLGPQDLFAILQRSTASMSFNFEREVKKKLGHACVDCIRAYILQCQKKMDFDLWEDELSKDNPEGWQTKRMQYLFAFCNDLATIQENLETIELKFADASDSSQSSPFQDLQDQFFEFATFYIDEIVGHVDRVVQQEWTKLFVDQVWLSNDSNPLSTILDTIGEFIDEDFSRALQDAHLGRVVKELMYSSFKRYLTQFVLYLKASGKWKQENEIRTIAAALDRDADILLTFWKDRITGSRTQKINEGSQAIRLFGEAIVAVSTADTFEIFLENRKFVDTFGDCPTFVWQLIVDKRGDLSKQTRKSVVAKWADRISFQRRENDVYKGWKASQTFFGALTKPPEKDDTEIRRVRAKEEKRKQRFAEVQTAMNAPKRNKPGVSTNENAVEIETMDQFLMRSAQ